MKFEWDEEKNKSNKEKHDVDFDEAKTIFYDENAILTTDPDHSEDEDRFVLIGMSIITRVIVVVHCIRNDINENEVIRIISARKANDEERRTYERQL